MKKCKKANVVIRTMEIKRYIVQCPHCSTWLEGGFDKDTLRMKCGGCGEPIELIFEGDEELK